MQKIFILVIITTGLFSNNFDAAVDNYNKGAYIKALDGFYALAKEGNDKAQYNVALMYQNGQGLKTNPLEAMRWYEKASKQENGEAQYNLAQMYHILGTKDIHAYKKAKYWYEKAIKSGVTKAYNNLATLYLNGQGVEVNEAKAFEFFKKSASMGDAVAQVNLAVLYAWGKDITQDKMKAYENFLKALKSGKSEASRYLDKLCKESVWVCKD